MLCRCSQYRYDIDICDAEMLLRLLLLSVHLTKAISFIVYYIVTFYRLSLLIDISISAV